MLHLIALAFLFVARPDAAPSPAATPAVTQPSAQPAASDRPSASASASASAPSVSVDPAAAARAKNWLHRTQTGTIDRAQLDDQLNALLTDALVKQLASQLGSLGNPIAFEYVETKTFEANTLNVYKVSFTSGISYWLFSTNAAGKITGMRLVPPPQ